MEPFDQMPRESESKLPFLRVRQFLQYRWQKVMSRRPEMVRLPFGAYFVARKDALGSVIQDGSFENQERRFVERFLQPGMTVLDIGANQGYYSLLASLRVGKKGRVVAFEPSARERRALRINLLLNGCMNVSVERVAISDEDGNADFYVVHGPETGCNSLRQPLLEAGVTRVSNVVTRRLDRWLLEHNFGRVDLLKIDVEGAEISVIKGALNLLSGSPRPVILAEVANIRTRQFGYESAEIVSVLAGMGYEWFQPMEGGGLRALEKIHEREMNLIAIPKEAIGCVLSRLGYQC